VSPNFYRLPELLRNSGHSKVVSKKRKKKRAGKSMSLVLKVKSKGRTGKSKRKIPSSSYQLIRYTGVPFPPAQISFSFMNKRKTTERKLKIKEKHDN
jgi:hypothetical protein